MTHMLRVLDIYPHLVYNQKYGQHVGKSSSPMEPRASGQETETVETVESATFFHGENPQVHRHCVSWMLPPQEGHGETSLRQHRAIQPDDQREGRGKERKFMGKFAFKKKGW